MFGNEPSTGKSSNSSSSSSAAEAFCGSFREAEELESETMALVVSREPPLGAADMMLWMVDELPGCAGEEVRFAGMEAQRG